MSAPDFGFAVLEKYGKGRLDAKQQEQLQLDLRKELTANAGSVNAKISNDVVEKEISKFLDFGYASENNLDRLRRRVLRQPEKGRAEDGMSVRTGASMAYSQPPAVARIQKSGQDTPAQLFSITEGMKSQTNNMMPSGSQSARAAYKPPSEADQFADYQMEPPNSARSSARSLTSAGGLGNGCKWSTVAKLNALREVKDAEDKKNAIKNKQLMLKSILDEQVQAKSATVVIKKDETRMLRCIVDDDYQRLLAEEANKKKRFQEAVTVLKTDRQDQIVRVQQDRQQDRQETLLNGQELARQANRALAAEQKKGLEKKVKEKQQMSKLITEWHEEKVVNDAHKKVAVEKEKAEVIRLQAELRAEEAAKQDAMREMIKKRDAEFEELAAAEANAKQAKKMKREKRIMEENRALETMRKAQEEQAEKDRLKVLAKRAERVKNVEFLFKQIGEKQVQKKQEVVEKGELLGTAKAAIEANKQLERQKFTEKRTRNVQHRLELEEQIHSRIVAPARVREDLMSTAEAFLNKGVVAQAGQLGLF